MTNKKIIITGAGVTGLAAAWKLSQQPGYDITIIERDSVPGGLARTFAWEGYKLDLGPHRFHTEIPEIREFIRTFCEENMERVDRFSRMVLNGKFIPYPIKPLPTFRALGLSKSISFGLSALSVLFQSKAPDQCSYEEYVSRYYGYSLYKNLFEPFAVKVWGIPPTELAGETARLRLKGDSIWHALIDGLLSRQETYVQNFLYPPEGIGQIPQKFADEAVQRGVNILYEHSITKVHHQNNAVKEITIEQHGEPKTLPCDILISTIPVPALLQMIEPKPQEEMIGASKQLTFRDLVLLYLIYDRDYGIRDTWLYFPEANIPFSRISVPENFSRLNQIKDQTCLCLEYPCVENDAVWNMDADTLAQEADRVLMKCGLVDTVSKTRLAVQVKDGYPIYHTNYQSSLQTCMNYIGGLQHCLTVGRQGLFRHNNTDQSIQMGLDVAQHILSGTPQADWYDNVERYNDYRIVD
jgi:protoporphyrinogen oxidase